MSSNIIISTIEQYDDGLISFEQAAQILKDNGCSSNEILAFIGPSKEVLEQV